MSDNRLAELATEILAAGPVDLLLKCREICSLVAFPSSDLSKYIQVLQSRQDSFEINAILAMFEVELLLFYGTEHPNLQYIEQKLKFLAPIGGRTGDVDPYVKLKYHDLLTDYQYFYGTDREFKSMDLVNKKLNSLNFVSDFEHPLVEDLQLKILLFYLMSGADFRKRNVKQYLLEEQIFQKSYGEAIDRYKEAYIKKPLVSPLLFHGFLNSVSQIGGVFHFVCSKYPTRLLENFLDVNISKLPHYFSLIRLSRIYDLLLEGKREVDIEDIIYRMIVANELPTGTSIDQLEEIVNFGDSPADYSDFNNHIKSICNLVDRMSSV